jgi:predicted nucleic acid-binding protein
VRNPGEEKEMILLDTGPIVAFFDASDHYHHACIELLKTVNDPLVTTWLETPT